MESSPFESKELKNSFKEGDIVECTVRIAMQDFSPGDVYPGDKGIIEKVNTDGSYIVAWESGKGSTFRTHARPHQIEKS